MVSISSSTVLKVYFLRLVQTLMVSQSALKKNYHNGVTHHYGKISISLVLFFADYHAPAERVTSHHTWVYTAILQMVAANMLN